MSIVIKKIKIKKEPIRKKEQKNQAPFMLHALA